MKKFLIAACAGAASLGLVACEDTADETAMTDDAMVTETAPMETEAMTQDPVGEPTADLDGDGDIDADDRVTITEDGMQAEINDGNTSVTADVDENPGVTVRD